MWDGNEVWLLAGGGTLFFAFPLLYASSFSGFYMPLMMVLWLLILRGISIELRSHFDEPGVAHVLRWLLLVLPACCWRSSSARRWATWCAAFRWTRTTTSSCRCGPILAPGACPGILDWYTVLGGVMALLALALHGALYLCLKTEGELARRARAAAGLLWPLVALVSLVAIPATVLARPDSLANYHQHPVAFLSPVFVVVSLVVIVVALRKRAELTAFLASCLYLIAMLCGAAAGLFPVLLPSTNPAVPSITIAESVAGPHTLRVGLVWWTFGTLLAVMYFCIVYWLFRGKVSQHAESYGH